MKKKLDYKMTGVDYAAMDPLKRLAQLKGKETAKNLRAFEMREIEASRGESAYVWEERDSLRAFVVEGLGTKNRVADETRKITGKTYYDAIAQDTVAMIVNDLIVVGAAPVAVNAYFAVGRSDWFSDEKRTTDLVTGWAQACTLAGAAWGGGETPTLKTIIEPDTIDLAGSAIGIIQPKKQLTLGDRLRAGDAIILIESSGIHANGLTLARTIADTLPDRYATKLSSGTAFGEALLRPTHIYAKLIHQLFISGIDIHYMVNITGHGWRKLMRANKVFTYRMRTIPHPHEEFLFIQQTGNISDEEMYATFNMGAGFAVMVSPKDSHAVMKHADNLGLKSWDAGIVEKGKNQVIIEPKNITFSSEKLAIR